MSKDYIGKKKSGGIWGLIFFCLLAFVATFVISYSVSSYRNIARETELESDNSRLSKELDELFAEEEETAVNREEITKTESVAAEPEIPVPAVTVTLPEEPEDTEVSVTPSKAVVPLESGSILKNFSTVPEYSTFFEDWRSHSGVDISRNEGDEVHTIADGTVVESYIDPLCGGTMKIDHGAFYSVYMGLDPENMEMNGTVVKRGDVVGLLQGNIMGETAEPHLHFEIIENEVYTDPLKYIG